MSSWNNLPLEVLRHIFRFLYIRDSVNNNKTYELDDAAVPSPPKDVFEYQLTCKRWSKPVQKLIYRSVCIKRVHQFKSFIRTLEQDFQGELRLMVEAISIGNELVELGDLLITTISRLCPNVRIIETSRLLQEKFYVLLMSERYEGNFTKVQTIPPFIGSLYDEKTPPSSAQYYELASWAMRSSLKRLTVYDWFTFSNTNINRFEKFKSLTYLDVSLKNYRTFFGLDKQLQECLSLKSLHVINEDIAEEITSSSDRNNVSEFISNDLSLVCACPHIKMLNVSDAIVNDNAINYMMRVFPKLDKLILGCAIDLFSALPEEDMADIIPLSTNVSIQFLEYLVKIPDFTVSDLCVEKPADVLKGFYGIVEDLKIYHLFDKRYEESTAHLVLSHRDDGKQTPIQDKRSKIKPQVTFDICKNPATLPHTDLIDTLGHGLSSLTLYMGEGKTKISDNLDFASNGYYMDQIFKKCFNLIFLNLALTHLLFCCSNTNADDSVVQLNEKLMMQTWTISHSFINPDFLTSISHWYRSIGNFTLSSCRFVNPDGSSLHNPTNVKIDMPNVKFSTITWEVDGNSDTIPLPTFYLKLEENNCPSRYFAGNSTEFAPCSKEAYQDSLIDGSKPVYFHSMQGTFSS